MPALVRLAYALVDVFAERPLEGNMLAIFTDARGLSTDRMQALARETNLAETTFILPADASAAERTGGVRVRIFTTVEELPFAGHPTLGTAAWLHGNHPALAGQRTITLELLGGPVTVCFDSPADRSPPDESHPDEPHTEQHGVFGTMAQADPVFGSLHDRATVARLLDVPDEALDPTLPIQTVSTGLPFAIVAFRSVEDLGKLAIAQARVQAYLAATDAKFFFCIAPTAPGSHAHFRARMQFYNGEDPATGSASGSAIAFLVRYGRVQSATPVRFEQGVEIRRPSLLHVEATRRGDAITDVFVGGRTVCVASGQYFLPAGS